MKTPLRLFAFIACLVASCAAQTARPSPLHDLIKVEAPTIILTHARVIDGTGGAVREDQTIIISGGKIQSLGNASSTTAPADAKVIDLTGKSVIPGLVGMHDHMFYPAGGGIFHEMAISFPRLYLAAGVTS